MTVFCSLFYTCSTVCYSSKICGTSGDGLEGGLGAPPDDMRSLGILTQEYYEKEICLLSNLNY